MARRERAAHLDTPTAPKEARSRDLASEADFRPRYDPSTPTFFLPGTRIEIIRTPASRGRYEHVLFDFDGTLSLIREGWPEVMVPMMVEILQATGTRESFEELRQITMDFVMRLTGKQTLYQMIHLREEVVRRGGQPLDPLEYKRQYHDRLMAHIASRREALASGRGHPDDFLVPGCRDLLAHLVERGMRCYLASGTDENYVLEEAGLLGLTSFFEGRIFGAKADVRDFSKAMVIERILKENRIPGDRLLGFGDGYVEIENIKAAGGAAVAVASDEAGRSGRPDPWKRHRLVGIGADLVIPDFQEQARLVSWLMGDTDP
ncbi:MAG: HAD family hydrolase [Planctomycetes bacterium]|nr:HAD family hydrolase [Planctomycetota bacterium]